MSGVDDRHYHEEDGTWFCGHCDFEGSSKRSVTTHYGRAHDDTMPRNFRHGMHQETENFTREEKLQVWAQAQDYVEQLGGSDAISQAEEWDCYYLSTIEFRIARAEGIMFDDVEEYLEKETPERNLDMMVNRRQDLRKDLGLLETDAEKAGESAGAFFDAMADDE